MAGKKGMKHYSVETKLEAVRMFFEEGRTRAEVAKALGLRKAERVKLWTKQYRHEGVEAFTKSSGRPRKVAESEKEELARLRIVETVSRETVRTTLKKMKSSLG